MKKQLLGALLLILSITSLHAQNLEISGTITDQLSKNPLVGAIIVNLNTNNYTVSDASGNYEFIADASDKIEFRMLGYTTYSSIASVLKSQITLVQDDYVLNQVVVSASRDAQKREEAPMAISSIGTTMLEETKPQSLEQVINKVPGVMMADLGSEQHMMAIRQPISTKSLFLYMEDGLPIRPTGVFNHNALNEINMTMAQNIEVIRGPASALYGSEAIGGAINFITKTPSLVPTAKVQLRGDSYGYRRVDAIVEGTTDNGKLGVSVGGYSAIRENGYLDHSDFNKSIITAVLTYQVNESLKLTSNTTYMKYQSDMGSSLDSTSFYDKDFTSLHNFTKREIELWRSTLTVDKKWSENSKTVAKGFFRTNTLGQIPSYRIRNDWTNPSVAKGEVNESSLQSYGAVIQHNQNIPSLRTTVRVGASVDYSPTAFWANYIDVERDEKGRYVGYTSTDSVLTDYETNLLNTGLYAQVEVNPIDRLFITAGVRSDHFKYDYKNNLGEDAFSGAPNSVDYFSAITPRVGATYTMLNGLGFYANYSVGFMPPQVSELYRGTKVPSLEPSRYNNFEVGTWYSLPKGLGYLELAYYTMKGENEIVSVLQDDGSYNNENAGSTNHEGVEMALHFKPISQVFVRIGGTYASHTFDQFNTGNEDFSGNTMANAPNWVSNMELTYKPKFLKGFRTSLEFQKVGDYYMDNQNTKKYEGYHMFNLRFGYQFKGFDTWLNIMNLTDELYATRVSRSSWGENYNLGAPRTIQLGIGYTISKK
ncbi:TonB-dependent receptor [Flammeovirga sp. EKP202]|uniref:TonB-dependent receptor n=1 Tax=Flammeovirga sp. EKP202 TaxID=2770592 RepID=UPI00165F124C|nr:TonB-dependent receptor [Flammeovirga sp. EKP202]MBD0403770.1 TonB-dependent receptor [Flammeovirga sp. EKP202]